MNIDDIKKSLEYAISLDTDVLFAMGQKGSKVVYDNYYYVNIAKRVYDLYSWIMNNGMQTNNDISL